MSASDVLRLSAIVPEGEPPSEFRIFAFGETETTHGPYLFDEVSAALVMKSFAEQGNELMIDYEHKSLDASAPAGAGKAAGWFTPEIRGGELWATGVRWTEDAADGLRKREWRYFSPAILLDPETRRVVQIINVALTNIPATSRMEPLMAARTAASSDDGPNVFLLSSPALVALLGLGTGASEKEIAEEVGALRASAARGKDAERAILAATGADTVDTALGVLAGWKSGAEQVVALTARVCELEADADRREREALLAQHARKFTPAMKEWAKAQTLDALRGFVASAPDIPGLVPAGSSAPLTEPQDPGPASLDGKKWEDLSPSDKHDLHFDNRALYDALKTDHARRTKGARA